MQLTIENVGKVKKADIVIKGITVITGENDTGKSTIGKSLFSIFNTLFDIHNTIKNERLKSYNNTILDVMIQIFEENNIQISASRTQLNRTLENNAFHIEMLLNSTPDEFGLHVKQIFTLIKHDFFEQLELEGISTLSEKNLDFFIDDKEYTLLDELLKVQNISDERIINSLAQTQFNYEFNNQINNTMSQKEAFIQLKIKNNEIAFEIENNKVVRSHNASTQSLKTQAIYIDDPFILDEAPFSRLSYLHIRNLFENTIPQKMTHREHLKKLLTTPIESNDDVIQGLVREDDFNNVSNKINSVVEGEIISGKNRVSLYKTSTPEAEPVNIKNLSSGLKTFLILKTLYLKGNLEKNGTIILDEPEVHLHPQWQILFAEIIVLLQKELNMHILITTHSPYFLNALEVFAEKENIKNMCKFYIAKKENNLTEFEDITNNLEITYKKMAEPFQRLETMRYNGNN